MGGEGSLPVAWEVRRDRKATHSRWTLPFNTSLIPLAPGWVKVPRTDLEVLKGGQQQLLTRDPSLWALACLRDRQATQKRGSSEEEAGFPSPTAMPVAEGTLVPQLTPCYLCPNPSRASMFNSRQTSPTLAPPTRGSQVCGLCFLCL